MVRPLLLASLGALAASCGLLASATPAFRPFEFTSVTTGFISGYNHVAPGVAPVWKNDASGAALVDGVIVLVDDLMASSVRMYREGKDEASSGVFAPLPTLHKDLEGATQSKGKLIITCSMTSATDDAFNQLSEFNVDPETMSLTNATSVTMRAPILNAIQTSLGEQDPTWFARTQTFGEKDGNLNIEGISEAHKHSGFDLVWGLRSPLFAPDFASFKTVAGKRVQVLDSGDAILVFVKDAFQEHPEFKIKTLDLKGKGVRSIEYIPSLDGYLISSGPVPKADTYALWLYRPAKDDKDEDELTEVTSQLPEFLQLGRPEGILDRGGKNITIYSEQDPTFASPRPFNFIEATIKLGKKEKKDNDHDE